MMKKRPGSQQYPTDTMPSHNSTKRKNNNNKTHTYILREKWGKKPPDYFCFLQHFQAYVYLFATFGSFSVLEAMVATKYFVAGCIYKESWIWFYFLKKVPPLLTLKYL